MVPEGLAPKTENSRNGPLDGAEKRRTTRVAKRVPITVTGVDALCQSFKVVTETVSVSCHDCKYRSECYVPKHSIVTIEIAGLGFPLRIIPARVVWVQRPGRVSEQFNIGWEFDTPENVWGIALPPDDWLPFSKDQAAEVPATTTPEVKVPTPCAPSTSASVASERIVQIETKIYEMAGLQAESWDAQLHETIERAVEKSITRISESTVERVVQQVVGPLAAAIAEKVGQEITDKLDIRIEKIIREAVSRKRKSSNQATH